MSRFAKVNGSFNRETFHSKKNIKHYQRRISSIVQRRGQVAYQNTREPSMAPPIYKQIRAANPFSSAKTITPKSTTFSKEKLSPQAA